MKFEQTRLGIHVSYIKVINHGGTFCRIFDPLGSITRLVLRLRRPAGGAVRRCGTVSSAYNSILRINTPDWLVCTTDESNL
jgi:hypothetical protein